MQNAASTISLFGASPGTGNLGVDALCWSAVQGLQERGLTRMNLFSHGTKNLPDLLPGPVASSVLRMIDTQVGKRVWRRNHITRVTFESHARIPGNPVIETVRNSGAVLDVSAGDSFTDLYGKARFKAIIAPKRLALRIGRPLVLLPQTYGPFNDPRARQTARSLISGAALAFARDPDSFANLKALLGEAFDPYRHREGVDLAFGLKPKPMQPSALNLDLQHKRTQPLIGINVSGLLVNRAAAARTQFNLRCDYLALMEQFVVEILTTSNARIVLIPHVQRPAGHPESDQDACRQLLTRVAQQRGDALDRISLLDGQPNACEIKWLISQLDWFCGARMHATIAAISSGVPAAILAYSIKANGIFTRAGQSDAVIDLRATAGRDALERLLHHWRERDQFRSSLQRALPGIQAAASDQLDAIAAFALQHTSLAA